jgi:septal ring factor EnvC (AmiA/AmiB activator)
MVCSVASGTAPLPVQKSGFMYQERDNSAPARAYEAEDPQPRELDQAFVEAMAWRRARETYNALVAERDGLKAECSMLERENDLLREQLRELQALNREMRAATWARYEAWEELARLHRERMIDLARKAERTPDTPLH